MSSNASDRQCRHFDMTFKNGERVLVCLGCQKFWPMPSRVLTARETLRLWAQERGSILLSVLVLSLSLSIVALTIKLCMSPDFQFLHAIMWRPPR